MATLEDIIRTLTVGKQMVDDLEREIAKDNYLDIRDKEPRDARFHS